MSLIRLLIVSGGSLLAILNSSLGMEPEPARTRLQSESFLADPGWEGFHNHVIPKAVPRVRQDFGYSPTLLVGDSPGEIGGRVQRSTTPAYYAARIAPRTLDDKLSASGTFAITSSQAAAGLFFGFFNSAQPGGSGRPIGSLGLDFDFESSGGRLAVRLITGENKTCGTFITPFIPGGFRPTTLRNDGTRYQWTLDYDPAAGQGNGQFTFTISSPTHASQDYGRLPESDQQEALARFPNTTRFAIDVPPELRREGATFDRFGLLNMMKSGGAATIYFDDLQYNDQPVDLSNDPQWIESGNRVEFDDHEQAGAHDFGFSVQTAHAGGQAGELGGRMWRGGPFGYYADQIGQLDLRVPLEARGRVKLVTAGPDSDIFLGWFSRHSQQAGSGETQNFVGVHIGGPTRVGHYFAPAYATSKPSIGKAEKGPILTPGKVFNWSIKYSPGSTDRNGEISVTLGEDSVSLPVRPDHTVEGAQFDRFGIFTTTSGGQMVKVFFDDLNYTVEDSHSTPSRSE